MSNDGGDALSQWRAYADPGSAYAIGFDAVDFQRAGAAKAMGLLGECQYDPARHRALVGEAIEHAEATVAQSSHPTPHAALFAAITDFAVDFALSAPLIKDPTFADEREWRLMLSEASTRAAELSFRGGGTLLVPYRKVSLTWDNQPLPIREIVIGPTPHPKLEERAVAALLTSAGLSQAKVRQSKVPYRDW